MLASNRELYERAVKVIPAGVTRPFRFFEPYPFYARKAYGCRLVDVEGNEYVDYWMGHGALVLGHMPKCVVDAVKEQLGLGFHFGVCNEWEVKLAEEVCKLVPSVEMIRFNNSGTEANMHAIRLARAYTKRMKVGKFAGHFHGVLEPLYVAVNWPWDEPESAGIDPLATKNTVILPFNDLDTCSKIIKKEELACVFFEPVQGAACVPAEKEFIKGLREVCDQTGTLLIADEVITGFRLAPGGGQEVLGIKPDLTTFGKAIGGGEFPVGAVGGRRDIMELMDHTKHPKRSENVAQGGTYSGNPLVMRAGYAAMQEYKKKDVYNSMNSLGERLKTGLQDILERIGIEGYVTGSGSMVKIHFLKEKAKNDDLQTLLSKVHKEREIKYFYHLVSNKILAMAPGKVHFFISYPHTREDIDNLITVTENFVKSIK
ncbi:MAG: aspartate aminotransferase family protein [Nitrososphaeria archaeon]